MPDILVEVRGSWLGNRQSQLLEAVHAALVKTIRILPDDKVLRLVEHSELNFITPPGMSEKLTRIEIAMFVGRSLEAKRALYKELVRVVSAFGVPPGDVKVVLVEVPKENVGIHGGQAACDIDLGYEVAV